MGVVFLDIKNHLQAMCLAKEYSQMWTLRRISNEKLCVELGSGIELASNWRQTRGTRNTELPRGEDAWAAGKGL